MQVSWNQTEWKLKFFRTACTCDSYVPIFTIIGDGHLR